MKILTCFISHRTFGNVIHETVQNYSNISTQQLGKLEKLSIKLKKADLDIEFLTNCKIFNVIPKFLAFNLPYANEDDTRQIRKRLLRSAIKKRKDECYKLDKELRVLSKDIYSVLSSIDYYIVNSLINKNV